MAEGKICKNCGAALPENAKFCVKCGTAVEQPIEQKEEYIVCPRCEAQMEPGLFFCTRCGERLREGTPPTFLHQPDAAEQSQPDAPVNYALPAAPGNPPQTPPTKKSAAAPQPEAAASTSSAPAAGVQKKKSPALIIALGLFAAGALAAAGIFMTDGLVSADEHYKKAVDAMGELIGMNYRQSPPEEESQKQWLIIKNELKKAADKGTPDMKCDYASFLQCVIDGTPGDYTPDKKEIEKYLRKAAAEGSSRAKYYLSEYDVLGGTTSDNAARERAIFLTEACDAGNPYALHLMGEITAIGANDIDSALAFFKQAVMRLDEIDPEDTPFMENLREAVHTAGARGPRYITADVRGEWPAEIGAIYELGLTGRPNLQEALKWYEKSQSATFMLSDFSSEFIIQVTGYNEYGLRDFYPEDAIARVKRKMGRR